MLVELNENEVSLIVRALKEASAECNTFINKAEHQGYSKSAVDQEYERLQQMWKLTDKMEKARKYSSKPPGSTGTVDPYEINHGEPYEMT